MGNKFKRSLNPSRVSCQYQAVNACHQDSFIRTLHFRTKFPCRRQRYCQTRYTRRNSLCRDLCINAIRLVIPAISRIARSLNRQDRGRQQTYECTCNNQVDIAVRIAKSRTDSVACNVTTGHNLAVARYASRSYTCNNQDDTGMQHSTETML